MQQSRPGVADNNPNWVWRAAVVMYSAACPSAVIPWLKPRPFYTRRRGAESTAPGAHPTQTCRLQHRYSYPD